MLNHSERGEGPPLVLIHGLFGSLENVGALARRLSESFHCYSVDLPNHGRSPHLASQTLSTMAEQVQQWMQAQDISSAAFVGHSLGGKVAMELALKHPEKVERLAVLDIAPVQYHSRHDDVLSGLMAIEPSKIKKRADAEEILAQHVQEPAVRSFLLKNLARAESGFYWRINLKGIVADYAQLIKANCQGRYDGPALFLKAQNSDYITEAHRAELLQRFSHPQFKVVAETGHWLHAEKPDLVAALIKRFLQAE